MNKFQFAITRVIKSKIRRFYAKRAISKKKKTSSEWTDFERKFAMLMKRTVLQRETELICSWESSTRTIHNQITGLTIILNGHTVKVNDDRTVIVFAVDVDLRDYLNSIFDKATIARSLKLNETVNDLMLKNLKEIELNADRKYKIDFSHLTKPIKKFAATRRVPLDLTKEILEGANQ